jgi:transposase InsO family protein
MKLQDYQYHKVRKKLMSQLKRCRDREIRVKAEVILACLKKQNVLLICQQLGFGRSFFYKWWNRLVTGKFRLRALKEKSRRPKSSPIKIGGYIETRIKFYRRKGYGAQLIREYLKREELNAPSVSTIHHILNNRTKPSKKKVYKLKKHRKRYELVVPGQRFQLDVKYSPMLVGGKTVYIYVIIDECTRWRFAYAYDELNEHWTLDFLTRFLKVCPFPIWCIQTDNGQEFTFKLLPGETREHLMDTWCREHSIKHRLIPPGVKELNGKVERSHRIDADFFYGRAPTKNLEIFNRALAQWISAYNAIKPHGGIEFMTPLEKLQERIEALSGTSFEGYKEAVRQKFLKEEPMMRTKAGRQLLSLEKELRLYNLEIAS